MTREFYPVISVACLQLHYHVIPFLPLESRLSQMYESKIHSAVEVKEGQEQTWSPCVRVLEDTHRCLCIAFSPYGEQLVSGSDDGTVRLWNISTGALLQVMKGHSFYVLSVMYSPDGLYIASGSIDRTVRIWDAISGLQVQIYTGHSDYVICIAFSADGLRIASGDKGGQIHVWSTDAPDRSVQELETSGMVLSLAFISPNRLMVASAGGSIGVFDLGSASCIEQHDNLGKLIALSV